MLGNKSQLPNPKIQIRSATASFDGLAGLDGDLSALRHDSVRHYANVIEARIELKVKPTAPTCVQLPFHRFGPLSPGEIGTNDDACGQHGTFSVNNGAAEAPSEC